MKISDDAFLHEHDEVKRYGYGENEGHDERHDG